MIGRSRQVTMFVLWAVLACGSIATAATLSGRVYEGQTGVEPPPLGDAKPLVGVTVNLYGANNADQMGTYITHTTTDSDGWYGLWFSTRGDEPIYEYYNIVPMTPPGYVSEGATSVSGEVRAADWIQYELIELDQTATGNKFWYQPITIMQNQAPVVYASSDSVETALPPLPYSRPLAGVVSDDGLPEGEPLVIEWTLVDGPSPVVFEDAGAPQTTAHFYGYGTYLLRLTADDGELEAFDEVMIEIRESAPDWGGILFEWWFDIGDGVNVDDLRGHPRFPDQPDQSEVMTSFEGPTDWRDAYGTRARGYLHPPATGDYTFWISSDDASELWLSMNEDPANSVKIAQVEVWNDPRTWDTYPEQQSEPQRLVGGSRYYVEVLHKEGTGGDHLAVAWACPEVGLIPENDIIAGKYLEPFLPGASIGRGELIGLDVGGALPPGSIVDCSPGACDVAVTAGGAGILGAADQFYYAHTHPELPPGGDFTAIARVKSVGPPDGQGGAQAGIMIREALDPSSRYAAVMRTGEDAVALQGRASLGGVSWRIAVGASQGPDDDLWLRLDRTSGGFTGAYAIGGEARPNVWMNASSYETPEGPGDWQILGLATTSHEQGVPIEVGYSDFWVGPYLGPPTLEIRFDPEGVDNQDIGTVGGNARYDPRTQVWTVQAAGADIWGTSDQFHFVHQPVSGDVQMTVTVRSLEDTHEWAKAGLMIRETLEPDSPHVMIVITPGRGVAFQWRDAPGEITHLIWGGPEAELEAPISLRMERTGNAVIGYYYSDGKWIEQGRTVVGYCAGTGCLGFGGLIATSHVEGVLTTARFDNDLVSALPDPIP